MHSVWSTLEWMGNTLLFLLAGILIGTVNYDIQAIDVAMVIVIYLLLQAIRAAMIIVFYPLLVYLGYGMSIQEAVFLTWAGLRGTSSPQHTHTLYFQYL